MWLHSVALQWSHFPPIQGLWVIAKFHIFWGCPSKWFCELQQIMQLSQMEVRSVLLLAQKESLWNILKFALSDFFLPVTIMAFRQFAITLDLGKEGRTMQSLSLHLADEHENLMWNAQDLVFVALFLPSRHHVPLSPTESEMQASSFSMLHTNRVEFCLRTSTSHKERFHENSSQVEPYRNFDQSMWMTTEWRHSVNTSYFPLGKCCLNSSEKFDRLLCSPPRVHPVLTYEEIPFGIQICLVCKAALHYIEAVVIARFHSGQSSAIRAVQHLH